jgi:hypothetical protein
MTACCHGLTNQKTRVGSEVLTAASMKMASSGL